MLWSFCTYGSYPHLPSQPVHPRSSSDGDNPHLLSGSLLWTRLTAVTALMMGGGKAE